MQTSGEGAPAAQGAARGAGRGWVPGSRAVPAGVEEKLAQGWAGPEGGEPGGSRPPPHRTPLLSLHLEGTGKRGHQGQALATLPKQTTTGRLLSHEPGDRVRLTRGNKAPWRQGAVQAAPS